VTPITKYPEPETGDGVLFRLREDYTQAVLDVFDAEAGAQILL
jgi:hypothetical protein